MTIFTAEQERKVIRRAVETFMTELLTNPDYANGGAFAVVAAHFKRGYYGKVEKIPRPDHEHRIYLSNWQPDHCQGHNRGRIRLPLRGHEASAMTGICSEHQGHEPGCRICETPLRRIDNIIGFEESMAHTLARLKSYGGKLVRHRLSFVSGKAVDVEYVEGGDYSVEEAEVAYLHKHLPAMLDDTLKPMLWRVEMDVKGPNDGKGVLYVGCHLFTYLADAREKP